MATTAPSPVSRSDELGKVVEALLHNVSTLIPAVKTLTALGRKYQKAMADCTRAAGSFWEVFNEIAHHTADYQTSTRFIGDAMLEISEVHRQIELQRGDFLRSYLNDFVLPLEAKLESEEKALFVLQKSYRDDCELRIEMVEQADEELRGIRKKFREKNPGIPFQDDRETQMMQTLRDRESDLYDVRTFGLQKALSLERKVHSMVVEKFCAVIKANIVYHGKSHNGLTRKINDWVSLVSNSFEARDFDDLLKDPTLVPRNRWLEDDTRHLLEDPQSQQQGQLQRQERQQPGGPTRKISQSAEGTLIRDTSPPPRSRWRPASPTLMSRSRPLVNGDAIDGGGGDEFYPYQAHVTRSAMDKGGGSALQLFHAPLSDSPESKQFGSLWTQDNSPLGQMDYRDPLPHHRPQNFPDARSDGMRSLGDLTESNPYPETKAVKSSSFEGLSQHQKPQQTQFQSHSQTSLPQNQSYVPQQPVEQWPQSRPQVAASFPSTDQHQSQQLSLSQPRQQLAASLPPVQPSVMMTQPQSQLTTSLPPTQPNATVTRPQPQLQQQQQQSHLQPTSIAMAQPAALQPSAPQVATALQHTQLSQPPSVVSSQYVTQPTPMPTQIVSQTASPPSQVQFVNQQPVQMTTEPASVLQTSAALFPQPQPQRQQQPQPPQVVGTVSHGSVTFPSVQQLAQQPVGMQPQVMLLQQPASQPVKPQLAPSLLDGPKYGMKFRALYNFTATTPSQISFREGDLIDAVGDTKDGWKYGENSRTRKSGWFPANYVEQMVALRDPRVSGPVPQYLRRNNADVAPVRPAIPAPDYQQRNVASLSTTGSALPAPVPASSAASTQPAAAVSAVSPPASVPTTQIAADAQNQPSQAPSASASASSGSARRDPVEVLGSSERETNIAISRPNLWESSSLNKIEIFS